MEGIQCRMRDAGLTSSVSVTRLSCPLQGSRGLAATIFLKAGKLRSREANARAPFPASTRLHLMRSTPGFGSVGTPASLSVFRAPCSMLPAWTSLTRRRKDPPGKLEVVGCPGVNHVARSAWEVTKMKAVFMAISQVTFELS